jgi:hypothetical protein
MSAQDAPARHAAVRLGATLAACCALLAGGSARADEARPEVPADLDHLRLDTGRRPYDPPQQDGVVVSARGELQGRFERWSELPLRAPAGDATLGDLGQRTFATAWLRVGARASYRERATLVVQADLMPRWILGDLALGLGADRAFAQDEAAPAFARLRLLHLDVQTGVGLLRIGQVGSHWGLGVLTNDGDHPTLFGDYRLGALVERVSFASKPLGAASPFTLAVAADAVLSDATARWADGDRAYQAVVAAFYERGPSFFGVYGARRWTKVRAFDDDGRLDVWVADASARHAAPLGIGDAYVYAEGEAAFVFGRTDAVRTTEVPEMDVRGFGFAGRVGVATGAVAAMPDGRRFGRLALEVEGGFASGDGNPYDGTLKRFAFDPNHVVGLVLFPYLLRAQTARAATDALDPALSARAAPGAFLYATHGGVAGAQYVFPSVVVRPTPDFDLKLGALVAVATSAMVDPYVTAVQGSPRNARGGDARARDLGLELDWGFEWRVPMETATLQLGLQQGVLFPGHAFDDAQKRSLGWQSVTQARFGMQF